MPAPKVGPPPPHVIDTTIGDEISLYDVQQEQVIVLNGTASDIWLLCDGEQTIDEIVSMIARSYQVHPAHIREDVASTIRRLVEADFLPPPE